MKLTKAQEAHIEALRAEHELLAVVNLAIIRLGGEPIPIRTPGRNGRKPAETTAGGYISPLREG